MLYPPTPLAFLVSVSGMAGIIGMIMPALTGSMINSVPTHMRALASGMYGSICNVIGFQMAPIVVGFASDYASNILVGWLGMVGGVGDGVRPYQRMARIL